MNKKRKMEEILIRYDEVIELIEKSNKPQQIKAMINQKIIQSSGFQNKNPQFILFNLKSVEEIINSS